MNEYKNIALSSEDLKNKLKLFNIKCKIIPYTYLVNYSSIDALLGKDNCVIILYLWKPYYGHWVCLTKNNNNIEYFNSYGGYVDYPILTQINENFRKISNQNYPYLSKLLLNSKYRLQYNEFEFQKKKNNIKTCGRHCFIRILLRKFDIYEYKKILDFLLKKYKLKDYDDLVTFLTA